MGKQIFINEREYEALNMAYRIAFERMSYDTACRVAKVLERYDRAREQRNFKQGTPKKS